MTRFLIAAVLIWFCQIECLGQSVRLDSLRASLMQLPPIGTSAETDTARLQTLFELSVIDPADERSSAYLQQSRELIKQRQWANAQPWQCLYEGILLFRQNYIYQAIDKHLEALSKGERTGASGLFFAKCHRQLGSAYFVLEEYKIAKSHYEKTLALYQKSSVSVRPIDFVAVRNNIGICYTDVADYKQAINTFKEILPSAHQRNDSVALVWTYTNLGTAERKAGNYQNSIASFTQSIAFAGDKHFEDKAYSLSEQALAYLSLGEVQKALQLSEAAKKIAANGKPFYGIYIADAAYRIEKKSGLYENALADLERYDSLKLINDKALKQKSIDGFRFAYENQKKEIELEKQRFRNVGLMIGIVAACLFIIYFLFNQHLLRRKTQKIEQQKKIIEVANNNLTVFNQELEARVEERTYQLKAAYDEIRTAMTTGQAMERKRVASELHDNLGSMISGIRFQMQVIDADLLMPGEQKVYMRVYEMLGDAYNEVRNISHNLIPSALETKGLYAALSGLVADLNMNGRVHFSLIADSHPTFSKKVDIELYSILLELTNNLLKYSTATQAIIAFADEPTGMKIILQDNGQPYDFQVGATGKGIANILNRVATINGTLLHKALSPTGNCVEIQL